MGRLLRSTDPVEIAGRVVPKLEQSEAEFNLILGVLANPWREQAYAYVSPSNGVALFTGMGLVLAGLEPAEVSDLVEAISAESSPRISMVVGPPVSVEAFAAAYGDRHGLSETNRMSQRIYRLDRVIPVPLVRGARRFSQERDVETCSRWMIEFTVEATHRAMSSAEGVEWVRNRHAESALHVWEVDGEIVTMTGTGRRSRSGITVNAVYTPPEHRRKGYASALVAAVSQYELDSGRAFVALYTDLSNPTSNRIYQEIGFQPVADSLEIRLG